MLRQEADYKYIVYPSWAEESYVYPWREVAAVLANPLKSARLKGDAERLIHQPELYNPPTRLIDGPAGGGLIVVGPAGSRALNVVLFRGVANIVVPDDMRRANETFSTFVGAIEPYTGIGGLLTVGKRAKIYSVRATAENAEAAGADAYWVMGFNSTASTKQVEQILPLASGFGLSATVVGDLPKLLKSETDPWFTGWKESRYWYRISQFDDRAGLQFGILLYIALHMKKLMPALRWAHLVARIEGRPNIRSIVNRVR